MGEMFSTSKHLVITQSEVDYHDVCGKYVHINRVYFVIFVLVDVVPSCR